MNLPGENSITLSYEALGAIVRDHLNHSLIGGHVRVTNVARSSSFKDELVFEITSDPPEPVLSSVFARPEVPLPEPLPVPEITEIPL